MRQSPGDFAATPASGIDMQPGDCQLVGPFSLVVQCVLGVLALSALVYKRQLERPKRPSKVWFFDVSKQVLGSFLIHMTNLVASAFIAGEIMPGYLSGFAMLATRMVQLPRSVDVVGAVSARPPPNPCSYYLLNLGIDTTIGIPILFVILRLLNYVATFTPLSHPPESIESGNYGSPPRKSWWFKQSLIYGTALMVMKACVVVLITQYPSIVIIGDYILGMAAGNISAQILFVMLLFPATLNAMQYCIIDMFIKKDDSNLTYLTHQTHHTLTRNTTNPNSNANTSHHGHSHNLSSAPTTHGSFESGSSYREGDDIFFRPRPDEHRKKRRRRGRHGHGHRRHRSRQDYGGGGGGSGGGGRDDVYGGVVAILTEHTLLLPPQHHQHQHQHHNDGQYKATRMAYDTSISCH